MNGGTEEKEKTAYREDFWYNAFSFASTRFQKILEFAFGWMRICRLLLHWLPIGRFQICERSRVHTDIESTKLFWLGQSFQSGNFSLITTNQHIFATFWISILFTYFPCIQALTVYTFYMTHALRCKHVRFFAGHVQSNLVFWKRLEGIGFYVMLSHNSHNIQCDEKGSKSYKWYHLFLSGGSSQLAVKMAL